MKLKLASLAAMLVAAPLAFAAQGGIGTIAVEPGTVKAGQEVKITINAEGETPTFCGLGIEYGDGTTDEFKIDQSNKQFPVTVSKRYAKAGSYTVKASGKKVTTHLPCMGKAEAKVTVEAAAAAPAPAAKAAGHACPEGYALKGKAGKAGDFTCAARKGAKKPEKVLECADGLEYFQTKTTLGCRKGRK